MLRTFLGVASAGAVLAFLGLAHSRYRQRCLAPLASSYTTSDRVLETFPDSARGRLYIVTGGSCGLGFETARTLFRGGAHVILAVRDAKAGHAAADEMRRESTANRGHVECVHLDLSYLASVRKFAGEFLASGRTLHGLVNNAGVFQRAGTTTDGFQTVWQTNAMAPALLTELLLPAASDDFRVVNVSSLLHKMCRGSIADRCPPTTEGSSYADYALSKACQISHASRLNSLFGESPSTCRRRAYAVEPGLVQTNIMRESSSWMRALNYALAAPILKSIPQGAATTLFCMLAPNAQAGFYADCAPTSALPVCEDVAEVAAVQCRFEEAWGKPL
jgi:NAD(P)-dependent dehydrogenase (short-subunit alcohol dehydrogenase family)